MTGFSNMVCVLINIARDLRQIIMNSIRISGSVHTVLGLFYCFETQFYLCWNIAHRISSYLSLSGSGKIWGIDDWNI